MPSDQSRLAGRETVDNLLSSLSRSAISSAGKTVWIESHTPIDGVLRSMGPSVYAGTAGMAMAYSDYFELSGNESARTMALSCLTHSFDHATDVPPAQRFGFYAGWSGMIYVGALISQRLESQEALTRVMALTDRLSGEEISPEFDLVTGAAGAVAAFSLCIPVLGDVGVDLADRAAGALEASARPQPSGSLAWVAPGSRGLPLTGFSHGASGVAWALLELWAQTGRPSRLETARRAFAYEQGLYDPVAQNWPDLRYYRSWADVRRRPPPCQTAWCHGAGGIALSRLRAFELTRDNAFAAETAAGWRAVVDVVDMAGVNEDPSLCHGASGNLDILLTLDRRREGWTRPGPRNSVVNRDLAAPTNPGGPDLMDPGLMLGAAGFAVHLMRQIDSSLPSPLLPGPIAAT